MSNLRAYSRRLRRLERQFFPEALGLSAKGQELVARLESARLRCNIPPTSPERMAEIKGMSIIEILTTGRQRAREEALKRERADCSDGPIDRDDEGSPIPLIEPSGEP
jgi:hypothetical protein